MVYGNQVSCQCTGYSPFDSPPCGLSSRRLALEEGGTMGTLAGRLPVWPVGGISSPRPPWFGALPLETLLPRSSPHWFKH